MRGRVHVRDCQCWHELKLGGEHVGSRCFFFSSRRRHTRCSRDWSSDVCSSDLNDRGGTQVSAVPRGVALRAQTVTATVAAVVLGLLFAAVPLARGTTAIQVQKVSRSEERRVGKRVDLGGRRIIKKKKKGK